MIVSLVGPNWFAKQRELRKIAGESPVVKIDAETEMSLWFEEVGQTDLFGQSRTVVAEEVVEKYPSVDQRRLVEHLHGLDAAQSEQQIIFLIESEAKLSSPLGEYVSQHKLMRFPLPTVSQVSVWLGQEAQRMGVVIDKPVASAMAIKFGGDQFALRTELERWALLSDPVISRADVDGMVPLQVEVNNFDVVNSWVAGQSGKALSQLAELRRQGVADQAIIGSFAWKIESLLASTRIPAKWSREQLEEAMSGLYRLDLGIKEGQLEAGVGLELWLVNYQPLKPKQARW